MAGKITESKLEQRQNNSKVFQLVNGIQVNRIMIQDSAILW